MGRVLNKETVERIANDLRKGWEINNRHEATNTDDES